MSLTKINHLTGITYHNNIPNRSCSLTKRTGNALPTTCRETLINKTTWLKNVVKSISTPKEKYFKQRQKAQCSQTATKTIKTSFRNVFNFFFLFYSKGNTPYKEVFDCSFTRILKISSELCCFNLVAHIIDS